MRELELQGKKSHRIAKVSWGRVEVESTDGRATFKDARLFPGGAREWDWNETGTRHVPGVQPADVAELLEHGAKVVVLSRGFYERLQVQKATTQLLESRGVSVHVLPTEEAVRCYNELVDKEQPVGALIHSTC